MTTQPSVLADSLGQSPWLTAVVSNIQDAILLLDETGQVIFESPAVTELLGVRQEAGYGTSIGIDSIHPDERDAVVRSFGSTIAVPGSVARATYRFRRVDGHWRHLEAVAKNLLDHPELRGVLITLRDVSDRIQALEAAERAGAARDEFLSRMSHELRTPLHAILGWAQLLESIGSAAAIEAAEQISAAGQHLLRLVDELLDLAAIREGRITLDIRPVEVDLLTAEAIDIVRPLAQNRDVLLRIQPPEWRRMRVMADANRFRQVLINLLSNAVKYDRYAGEVVVWWTHQTSTVRLAVKDSGPGIPQKQLMRVFERFERLGREGDGIEGYGLGLSISRRLIELMNGTIGVESRPGEGAEFWIELPAFPRWTAAEAGNHNIRG